MRTGRPKRGDPRPDSITTSFRFPRPLYEAIQAHARRMRKMHPYSFEFTLGDATRDLIVRGLKAAEAEEGDRS